jgi:hypothetical protein
MMRRLALLFAVAAFGPAAAQAPILAGDGNRLNSALAELKPQTPGVVDAFVIVAALDSDLVFNREAREAGRVLASRFGAEGRTIVLAEDEGAARADAPASLGNLDLALARASALMDRGEDVLVLYSTSHGSPRAGLNFRHEAFGDTIVTPAQFAAMLGEKGFQDRLIIVQACFAGQFIPALATPRTVVVTAASSMNSSFGCSSSNDWTFFGHALINQAMRRADTFARQFRRAVVAIIGWEKKLGIEPSNPQISLGSETGRWLAELDARAGAVPAQPVGSPPSELGE